MLIQKYSAKKKKEKQKDKLKDKDKPKQRLLARHTQVLPRKKKRTLLGGPAKKPFSASKEKPTSKQNSHQHKKAIHIKNISMLPHSLKKPLHRKSSSCMPEGKLQKSRIQKPAARHGFTKSQDNLPSEGYKPLLGLDGDDGQPYISKYASMSKAGCSMDQKRKVNQDSIFQILSFTNNSRSLFGVCDGHGVQGHLVAKFVKQILPQNLQFFMIKSKVHNRQPITNHVGTQCLRQAFIKTGNDLLDAVIDTNFSGSTAVVTLLSENRLWCANIGDSRAVLYSKREGKWVINPLSTDHKPELPSQAKRIILNNGRVEPYRDKEGCQMGPYRIWLKNEDRPGLAMTRSFGDYVASTIGVTCEPQIFSLDLCKDDKFVVMASDGLWEFLSNRQVLQLVQPYYMRNDAKGGCGKLTEVATRQWQEQDEVIDDISVVLLFFGNY